MANAADILVDTLIAWEVQVVFGLPGDGINGIMEALRKRQDRIRFIQVRHEESAAFMACAYAKWTGKLGVCLGTSGPGGAHFLTGQNLGANTVGAALFGFTSLPPGTSLPGTTCDVLVDPQLMVPFLTDANGALTGTAMALSLPADPVFNGGVLYEQLATLVPTANAFGIVTTNAQTVTLGSWITPTRGFYTVSHDTDANAAYANAVKPFGFALRFRTL